MTGTSRVGDTAAGPGESGHRAGRACVCVQRRPGRSCRTGPMVTTCLSRTAPTALGRPADLQGSRSLVGGVVRSVGTAGWAPACAARPASARPSGRLTTMPTARQLRADRFQVETLGEAGQDQGQLHLRAADAVAGAAAEGHPRGVGEGGAFGRHGVVAVGVERQRVVPHGGRGRRGAPTTARGCRRGCGGRRRRGPRAPCGARTSRPGAGGWFTSTTRPAMREAGEVRGVEGAGSAEDIVRFVAAVAFHRSPPASAVHHSIQATVAEVVSRPAPMRVRTWSRISSSSRSPSTTRASSTSYGSPAGSAGTAVRSSTMARSAVRSARTRPRRPSGRGGGADGRTATPGRPGSSRTGRRSPRRSASCSPNNAAPPPPAPVRDPLGTGPPPGCGRRRPERPARRCGGRSAR